MEATDSQIKMSDRFKGLFNRKKRRANDPALKSSVEQQSRLPEHSPTSSNSPGQVPENQAGTIPAGLLANVTPNDESSAGTGKQPVLERSHSPSGQKVEDGTEHSETADFQPISTLWDEVYNELAKATATTKLVAEYKKVLEKSPSIDKLSQETGKRREQMEKVVEEETLKIEKGTWKLGFAGHEFAVKDLVKPVMSIIEWGKDYVGDAVQVSPPASLAWAGVCLLLPVSLPPKKGMF
jgi:N-terminal domain of NWD NACHT-NTPase